MNLDSNNEQQKQLEVQPERQKRKYVKRKRGMRKGKKQTNVRSVPTIEDLIEAEKQRSEKSIIGHKANGDNLYLVTIRPFELKNAGYRLAVGGDFRKQYWTVRDNEGFFSIDGTAVFCLKGKQGRAKLQELVDRGFFDSPRLIHKDKL